MKILAVLFLFSPLLWAQTDSGLEAEVAELRTLVQKLQARLEQLEARAQPASLQSAAAAVAPQAPANTSARLQPIPTRPFPSTS